MPDSPETTRRRPRCAYCKNLLYSPKEWRGVPRNQRRSRDHILPRAYLRSGQVSAHGDIKIRLTCAWCNENRAAVGHCPAALAAAKATPQGVKRLREWWAAKA